MTSPRLSVIVPLFNKAAYVCEMLAAFSPQLRAEDELLVIDDQSTDRSKVIAQEAMASMPNARLITMPSNAGPATARNHGVGQALGTHVLFFDADDIPAPRLLDRLRSAIEQHPNERVFAYRIAFEARGESAASPGREQVATTLRPRHAFVEDSLNGQTLCTASSTCVARDTFLAEGGFQEGLRYCEDPELWARLSAQHPIVSIDETLATYRDVPQSLSYGLRGQFGSVNPYVDSLLRLAASFDGPYLALARSMIFKNLVFGRAAGQPVLEGRRQLAMYREALGPLRSLALQALNVLPRSLVQTLLDRRTARLQRSAAAR